MKRNTMKRLAAIMVIVATIMAIVSGCAGKTDTSSGNVNKQYTKDSMINLEGQPYKYQKGTLNKRIGCGYALTDLENRLMNNWNLGVGQNSNYGYDFYYLTEKGVNALKELNKSKKGSLKIDIKDETLYYAGIYRIPNDTEDKAGRDMMKYLEDTYAKKRVIANLSEDTYFLAWNEDYSRLKNANGEDKKNLDQLITNLDKIAKEACVFPSVNVKENMNDFSAKTLDGKTFSQEDLERYDLTMVNIWSTGCSACIAEMPELQDLYEKLPKNMNMISICGDAGTETELAKSILTKKGCKFTTLIPDEKLQESLLDYVDAFPTTIFVDSKGNIVGESQIGAPSPNKEEIADAYLKLIKERLEMSGEQK